MTECEKFIDNLPFHYQGGGLISIEEIGIRKGWKAALEWSQNINKKATEEYTDSQYGAIKQSIAIDVELRGE